MHVNTEERQKCENFRKKTFESEHTMICLLFASDDVMPRTQTTKQFVEEC